MDEGVGFRLPAAAATVGGGRAYGGSGRRICGLPAYPGAWIPLRRRGATTARRVRVTGTYGFGGRRVGASVSTSASTSASDGGVGGGGGARGSGELDENRSLHVRAGDGVDAAGGRTPGSRRGSREGLEVRAGDDARAGEDARASATRCAAAAAAATAAADGAAAGARGE